MRAEQVRLGVWASRSASRATLSASARHEEETEAQAVCDLCTATQLSIMALQSGSHLRVQLGNWGSIVAIS